MSSDMQTDDDLEMGHISNEESSDDPKIDTSSKRMSIVPVVVAPRMRRQNYRRRERLNTDLLDAVISGDYGEVARLISEGASSRACCRNSGLSALHLAAAQGDVKCLSCLLDCDANPLARDKKGREPAHLAAWNNHMAILKKLILKDARVTSSPINRADFYEDQNILDSRNHDHQDLDNMISVELEDGITLLHIACMKGYDHMLDFLIRHGANVECCTCSGLAPVDVAGLHFDRDEKDQRGGHSITETPSEKAAGLLTSKGKRAIDENRNPLISIYGKLIKGEESRAIAAHIDERWAKRTSAALHKAVKNGDIGMITYLLENGACMMAWNSDGETALHLAVRNKLYDPLETMLDWNAMQYDEEDTSWESKVDVIDCKGMTPLLLAAELGWQEGVELLLGEEASVTIKSDKNETVLHFAAKRGDMGMMEVLLSTPDAYTIIEQRDEQEYTPVCYAVESGSWKCLKLLSDHNANLAITLPENVNMLHKATEINSAKMITFLVQDDAVKEQNLVNQVTRVKDTFTWKAYAPIHIAAHHGRIACVKALIRGNCDVGLAEESRRRSTALHLAARAGHSEALKLILQRDRKTHEVADSLGWTPLHEAAFHRHSHCVEMLLRYGANLAACNQDKRTAIDIIMLCMPRPVEFLQDILDEFVTYEGEYVQDENTKITLNYEILVPGGPDERQLNVMNALLNRDNIDNIQTLLLHPLIETFLHLKWEKLKAFYVISTSLYLMMTISLTIYSHLIYVQKSTNPLLLAIAHVAGYTFISFNVIIFFLELIMLIQMYHFYIRDFESLIKWGVIITWFTVGMVDPTQTWTKYVAAAAVLLSWIELLFILSRFPTWGHYVQMFARVAVNVLKVLSTFMLLFIGFTFSFLILFEGKYPFGNLFEAFVKVLVMTFEFDYQNLFDPVNEEPALSVTGRLVFVSFVVLVSIVMMNLLVGLAVTDITALQDQGKSHRLVNQTQFLSVLEIFAYNKTLKNLLPLEIYRFIKHRRTVDEKITFEPEKPLNSINRVLPEELRAAVVDLILSREPSDELEEVINRKFEDLTEKVRRVSSSSSTPKDTQRVLSLLEDIQKEQLSTREIIENLRMVSGNDEAVEKSSSTRQRTKSASGSSKGVPYSSEEGDSDSDGTFVE